MTLMQQWQYLSYMKIISSCLYIRSLDGQALLTPWWPVYDIFVPGNWPKTSSFRLPYQHHSSSADCARELFKPSKDSASLLVRTRKTFFGWEFWIFCEWRHK